jgi:hypothetical protein
LPDRHCNACSLCCRLFYIEPLQKPANEWCSHCKPGLHGCQIYPDRPQVCRDFHCLWITEPGIADRYRPDLIGLYIARSSIPNTLQVLVDPDRPQAWTEDLGKKLLDHLHEMGLHLYILVGDERYLIQAK